MDLIKIVAVLIVVGAALYIVPMEPTIKRVIATVIAVLIALWLLYTLVGPIPLGSFR